MITRRKVRQALFGMVCVTTSNLNILFPIWYNKRYSHSSFFDILHFVMKEISMNNETVIQNFDVDLFFIIKLEKKKRRKQVS